MAENVFYVYEHWRPDRDECFYVGKGHGNRANQMRPRNAYHCAIQEKLSRLGTCVEVRVIADGLSEDEAFFIEKSRIAFWRSDGADLANMTDGGEGFTGGRITPEGREKIRKRHLGRVNSPETRKKISLSKKGHLVSEETRAKISASKKGRKQSEASKAALLKANTGRTPSEETRNKISAANKGRKRSQETIDKLKSVKSVISAETREKMRVSAMKRAIRNRNEKGQYA